MSEIIAVIDDDLHINNMLCELLSREGYKVIRAFSGGEALAVLEETTPDLILLDLMSRCCQGYAISRLSL